MTQVQYAAHDGVHVAFRVLDGPPPASGGSGLELVMVSGFNFPFDLLHEDRIGARLLEGLSSIGRVAVFDRRGVGLSDPIVDWERPLMDQWSDDLASVVDAAGFTRPTIFAWDVFGVARRFATRFPDACGGLVLVTPAPSPTADDAWFEEFWHDMRETTAGDGDIVQHSFPTRSREPEFCAWLDRAGRAGASPSSAARMVEATYDQLRAVPIDHHLIRVPTLVLARSRSTRPAAIVQRVADAIDGAVLVDLPGIDDLVFDDDIDALIAEVGKFLTGEARVPPPSRSLCAVLFTDLVSSTERVAALGDERWKRVLDRHDEAARIAVGRSAGRVVKTTGDGVLAVLPTGSAALHAAYEIRRSLEADDLEVRIGIHVAEVESRGDDVAGLGVHIAARIMSAGRAGEILVSATIPAVAVGGTTHFEPRGEHTLKGVPGTWALFAAAEATSD